MKTQPRITTTIEKVNASVAAEFLKSNLGHQRNVTASHVLHLAQQMKSGQWQMNGESIIFDVDGKMIDGQHRCHAIIKSDVTLELLITRGVETSSFLTINRGKIRTGGNIFTIAGYSNGNDIAAATANVINYRRAMKVKDDWAKKDRTGEDGKTVRVAYNPGSLNSYIRASMEDMMNEYESHKSSYDIGIGIGSQTKGHKLLPPSVASTVAALAMIEAKRDIAEVRYFWDNFNKGAGLHEKDPIWIFRERCRSNKDSKAKLSSSMITMMAIKAWNAYVTGKSISIIRVMDGEPCPAIL